MNPGIKPIGYSPDQLTAIRQVIVGLPLMTPADADGRNAAVAAGHCPERLWPLWPLAGSHRRLWRRLVDDARIAEFSIYGLFPAAYDIVYGAGAGEATARYAGRARGRVAIISGRRAGQPVAVVIKPGQSPTEGEIAAIAGGLRLGPRQLPGIAGFISEEFIAGPFLTDLAPEQAAPERMRRIGAALADALTRLHAAGVCYNDATICDPDGRSHIILRPNDRIRLIDFGVSLLLREHPARLTFHDAYNAARTDPLFRLFRGMIAGDDAGPLREFVAGYGRRLARQTPAQIQSRDWRIAGEGASLIAARFGAAAADALQAGLAAGRQ